MNSAALTSSLPTLNHASTLGGQSVAARFQNDALPTNPDRPGEFLAALRSRVERVGTGTAGNPSGDDPARTAAREFVALTFVQPILKQLRETNHAEAPFAPSQAERAFQGLADEEIARRIVRASNWSLVDRLTADLTKAARAQTNAVPTDPAPAHDLQHSAANSGVHGARS